MKKRKNKRLIYTTVLTTLLLVAIAILLVFGLIRLISSIKPFYETKERTEKITAEQIKNAKVELKDIDTTKEFT